MTEKIARRGVRVPAEYMADFLDQLYVNQVCSKRLITLQGNQTLADIRHWLASTGPDSHHQGYPVMDESNHLLGVVTRRDLLDTTHDERQQVSSLIHRPPIVVYDDCTLREAADHMVRHDVGRLPVIARRDPSKVLAMITRGDILSGHRTRISEAEPTRTLGGGSLFRGKSAEAREEVAD